MRNILLLILILLPLALRAQYSLQYIGDTEPTQCTGTILASVGSANTGPFTLELFLDTDNGPVLTATKSNVISIANFSNLCEGDYTVVFTDDFGCEFELPATIEGCNDITLRNPPQTYVTHSTDCNNPNGAIGYINQNAFNGGTGLISWEWSGGTVCSQGLCNLAPGTYAMTASDEEGCEGIFTFEIEGEELWLQGNASPACAGQNNGAVNAGAAFSTGGAITYAWSTGAATEKIDQLSPGVYSLTATHTNSGCTATQSWAVSALPDLGNLTLTGVAQSSCPGQSTGSIVTTVSGGTGPYHYAWSSNGFGAHTSYLPAKEYTITVTDYCGNVAVGEFEVEEFLEPGLQIIPFNDCAGDGTGGVRINQSGGSGFFYDFYLNGEYFHASSYNHTEELLLGEYTLEIVSSNGCNRQVEFRLENDTPSSSELEILMDGSSEVDCIKGEIYPTISGGNLPISFNWFDPTSSSAQPDISNEPFLDGVIPGMYALSAIDNCGDIDSETFDLTCNCEPQFRLTTSLPCEAPHKIKIEKAVGIDDILPNGLYDFTWVWQTEGSNPELKTEKASLIVSENENLEWENRNKTFLSAKCVNLTVSDPRGCQYNIPFCVNGQADTIVSISHLGNEGTWSHLSLLYPDVFEFNESYLGNVQYGCSSFKKCGDVIVNQAELGSFNYFPVDLNNPCREGLIECSLGGLNSDFLQVPENPASTFFQDLGNGKCGCLFPPSIFTEDDIIFPILVEFDCDELNEIEDTISNVYNYIDTTLCFCNNCSYVPATSENTCGYSVICLDNFQEIWQVEIELEDWNLCKMEIDIDNDETNDYWKIFYTCPLKCELRKVHSHGYFTETTPLELLASLPECPCLPFALLNQDEWIDSGELHDLDTSIVDDSYATSNVYTLNEPLKEIILYPNPSLKREFYVRHASDKGAVYDFKIYSARGELIRMELIPISNNLIKINVPLNLSPGIYFIEILFGQDELIRRKLVLL